MFSYVNVDYAVASALADDADAGIEDVVITYDIGCQWGKISLIASQRPPSYHPLTLSLSNHSVSWFPSSTSLTTEHRAKQITILPTWMA